MQLNKETKTNIHSVWLHVFGGLLSVTVIVVGNRIRRPVLKSWTTLPEYHVVQMSWERWITIWITISLTPVISKRVRKTGFFSLCSAPTLGEEKTLNSNQMYPALKLTLYHILLAADGSGNICFWIIVKFRVWQCCAEMLGKRFERILTTAFDQFFGGRGPHGIMTNVQDCNIIVSKFKPQSPYYVHFRFNTPGKCVNPLSSQL